MIPDWAMKLPLNLIYTKSAECRLNAYIVAAIVYTESSGDTKRPRYEPGYSYLVDPAAHARSRRISVETETVLQQMSWGLMQIMGATARDLGFTGDIPDLVNAPVGLHWGCKFLKVLHERYNGRWLDVIAAYNAGSPRREDNGDYENQGYVDKVT